jgi:hypothetical protein
MSITIIAAAEVQKKVQSTNLLHVIFYKLES